MNIARSLVTFAPLVLLACGSGLLKPNISTIVGNLYRDRPQLRDAGFNIFYMGINIGAILSPICVALLRQQFGWSVAFGSAGVAMILSLAIFVGFNRYVAHAAARIDERSAEAHVDPADARTRTAALLVTFAIVVAFWLAFYQNGFTLTFWARDNTRTSIHPEVFQSVEPGFIVLLTPLFVALWGALRREGVEPSTPMKMLIGMLVTAAAFFLMAIAGKAGGDTGRVSVWWLVAAYALIAVGEICLSPMGLSLVSRVAPPRTRGLLMGGWFVTLSLGAYFAGKVGGNFWATWMHSRFFMMVAIVTLIAAGVLVATLGWLKRTMERAAIADVAV
jgi:POT family proton-dependent oligopeptide transporter